MEPLSPLIAIVRLAPALSVAPGGVTDRDALDFAGTVRDAGGPALAFCRTGTRSTNLWKRAQQLTWLAS